MRKTIVITLILLAAYITFMVCMTNNAENITDCKLINSCEPKTGSDGKCSVEEPLSVPQLLPRRLRPHSRRFRSYFLAFESSQLRTQLHELSVQLILRNPALTRPRSLAARNLSVLSAALGPTTRALIAA